MQPTNHKPTHADRIKPLIRDMLADPKTSVPCYLAMLDQIKAMVWEQIAKDTDHA